MRKLRLFDWFKIIQRFGGLPSPVPFPHAPDYGLRPGLGLERVLRGRHTLRLSRGLGWEGRRPGLAGRRCPRRREQAVELCPAGCTVPARGARKDALQGAQAGLLRAPVWCAQLCFCRSRADPGGLFPSGRNPQTYPLYEVQFRETFPPFFGAR